MNKNGEPHAFRGNREIRTPPAKIAQPFDGLTEQLSKAFDEIRAAARTEPTVCSTTVPAFFPDQSCIDLNEYTDLAS